MCANRAPVIPPEDLVRLPRSGSWRRLRIDAEGLRAELVRNVQGEVSFDAGARSMYAVDASNYRQVPIGVVVPKSKDDVIATVAACRKFGAPFLSRGAGTSLAGQSCNTAIVVDWTKYMHGVLELNLGERWARVLPGTICDELREAAMKASERRLVWGPDPATHNHNTFGGMIGNNSCGAHAQMSGKCDSNIEELEILLYDGTRMTVGWMNEAELERRVSAPGRTGEIYRHLRSLRDRYAKLIRERYPPIPRRVSGYNLDQLLPGADGRFNVARALVGSEGTLVAILEAKCRLIEAKAERAVLMLGYPDVYEAADHIMEIDSFGPTALEGIDHRLCENIQKKSGPHSRHLRMLPEGHGWLLAEFGAEKKEDAITLAREVMDSLQKKGNAPSMKLFTDPDEMHHLWELRESGLGATAFVPGEPDSWPGWEDSAVAPERLGRYLRELRALFSKYGYNPALYGHFGQGCVHCRVNFDLTSQTGILRWKSFLEEATDLCVSHGGSLSGEHGDGQARAEFLNKMFGGELVQAFREFKAVWDPDGKMNPGKVVDPYRADENLRLGADYQPWEPETHFKYPEDHGSFAHAALRCVGIGECRRRNARQPDDDTMCPSFMVTHEERHTTRGRAHHLWEMLHGGIIEDGWRDQNVKEALELCLACKGCKGDCPVNVDMATYKAEFLSHFWEGRFRPRHAYAFAFIDQWSRLASIWPGLINLFTQTPGLCDAAKFLVGMPPRRKIPEFAPESFRSWSKSHAGTNNGANGRVVLWADTFNNYFFPETAQAATCVLESAGFTVHVPQRHLCCGRPLYDYGFLSAAKRYLRRILVTLKEDIESGTPIVVLEPSCASVFRDELHNLFPDDPLAGKLREQTFLLSEFLEKKAGDWQPPQLSRRGLVQGHCHHKSVLKFDDEREVFKKMRFEYELLPSGCCGMAGSFGFESDKYDVSVAIGERVLLPAVRKASRDTLIVADGFSCREQISQLTDRRALHLAEVIQVAQENDVCNSDVESEMIRQFKGSRRKARICAGIAIAGITISAILLKKFIHKR